MAQFSGAVKIGDLNDFIAPSQACVVSLQGQKQTAGQAAAVAKPPPPKEGLQLNARPSKRHQQQQKQELSPTKHSSTTSAAQPQPQPQPQPHQQQQHNDSEPEPQQQQHQKGGFQQTVLSGENQAVKVSLNDCLACSGCVTSAETVLLQAQSLKEFCARCEDPDTVVVVTLSAQSRASLAALHGISPEEVHARVSHFLKAQLSVTLVLDISLGQALALSETAAEFVARYKQAGRLEAAAAANGSSSSSRSSTAGQLPMLASACPGWVCYAEKTHGSYILPHIATTRSPQAITGSLVKQVLAHARGWDPAHVYHVTVMPCYDKKLEASRDDFMLPGTSVSEVDSCLSTGELQELLDKYGSGDLTTLPSGRGDNLLSLLMTAKQQQQQQQQEVVRVPEPLMHSQLGSSGGYADYLLPAAAAQLFGVDIAADLDSSSAATAAAIANGHASSSSSSSNSSSGGSSSSGRLPWKVLRNADMQELQLLGPDGQPLLRFALAYGFRNIQTVVRLIKTGRCPYDYIEVMACPSGCLNGGGQPKAPPGLSSAQLLEQLEVQFFRQQAGQGQGQPQAAAAAAAAPAGDVSGEQQQQPQVKVAPGSIQLLHMPSASQHQHQQQQQGLLSHAAAVPSCISSQALAAVYDTVLGGQPGDGSLQQLLHTQYHKREKTVSSTISDW